jgi:predicted DNA-binding transcriptional regulator YafY
MPLPGIYSVRVRARRLVNLLLLLQLGRSWTAAELARRLSTSLRTVHRDIEALREAGVPVVAARGTGGGFRLPEGYRSRLPLTEEEVAALVVGAPGAASALGLDALLVDARLKLIASLSADLRERAGRAAQLVHVDEPPWFHTTDEPPFLRQLAAAAAERRRLAVDYRAGRGGAHSRNVDPLGLVLKAGVWYLAGRSDDEIRVYRVSRIEALEDTGETFVPPPDFDVAPFWARARADFELSRPRVEVTVRLDRATLPALRRAVDWTVRPAIGDGVRIGGGDARVELVLPFERLDYAYADLVQLGGVVEVVAPPELRERLAAAGRSLIATYGPLTEAGPGRRTGTAARSGVRRRR